MPWYVLIAGLVALPVAARAIIAVVGVAREIRRDRLWMQIEEKSK
jgi:hypothetical protein